ncbi:hypothetical protein QNO21_10145 [Microbacterium sp. zg-Y818]|uniref:hypothetical protein n=1 Tax=unclassified Microbacterium TaxID=2609290 RepID=UPI00214B927F|nr:MULTISPECIES: hypothetical protein [unclassified Microbacterium]MCR2799486.1 hypothetical protein [Microbacterium sp. zg.Y818]WIM21483.1 hypothetical protein QNO21_10145 [Microbacterium sp. zg-Y818]
MASTDARATAAVRSLRWWPLVIAALVGMVGGFTVGRAMPPFYPDGQWWSTFLTSAGFAGSLAVVAAIIAAMITWYNSHRDRRANREADDRTTWWGRFTWGCEKAVSTKHGESEMGLSVLKALLDAPWAREEDNVMVVDVANVIFSNPATRPEPKKRWGRK